MGPSALRGAGLQASIKKLGLQVEDIGNLSVKQPEEMPIGEKRAKYMQEIAETCGDVAAAALPQVHGNTDNPNFLRHFRVFLAED